MTHPAGTSLRADRGPRDDERLRVVRAARLLLRDERADTFVSVGGELVGVTARSVRGGRLEVELAPGWSWPNDEPDVVGELVVSGRDTCTAVQLVGWWSPRGASALVLDLAEARVRSGVDVLVIDDDDATTLLLV